MGQRVTEYVRGSVLTAPDDLELHALVPWARGEAPLPLSERASIDGIVREWWSAQTDARELLRETIAVDQRTGVLGACACARWALERHWQSDDRRPWTSVETTEAWCRGEVKTHHVVAAANAALKAADAATQGSSAAYAAGYAGHAADIGMFVQDAASAANAAANEAAKAATKTASAVNLMSNDSWNRIKAEFLQELCDVVRAAIECPPAEVWLASELKRNSQ